MRRRLEPLDTENEDELAEENDSKPASVKECYLELERFNVI